MTGLPANLDMVISAGFWHVAIVFLRVAALVSVLPAFGERSVPMRVKLVVAVMFTAVVAPAVPGLTQPDGLPALARLVASETLSGLALGLGLRLFVLALHTAGSIAAQSTSLSQLAGGAAEEPMPAIGHVLVVAGLALAAMSGLHVRAAELLVMSYDLFAAGSFPAAPDLSSWGIARIAHAFALAFTLAAPFVIASVIYNLALGVINRAMPQLMVAFVGAPVITLGGLALLCVTAPVMLSIWSQALGGYLSDPAGMAR